MPDPDPLPPEDRYFVREARRLGFATASQVDECVQAWQAARAQGVEETLPDILIKRECITGAQARAILRRMGREPPAIPGYDGLERIGRGGMGVVFRARSRTTGDRVAIKVLYPEITEDPAYLRRFFREAQAARALRHPNIVQGIAVGYAEPHYYCVMEYVPGPNLDEAIRSRGPLPVPEAVRVLRHVARALKHVHAKGLVHRDIKPKNILLAPGGIAMLADLGLVKRVEDGSITQPEIVMGSALYVSPEQARGETYLDIRGDLYSLGATAFEMLTGRPPFDGKTAAAVLERKLREPVPDPAGLRPGLPAPLCRIVRRLLERDRRLRYADPTDLLEDLRRLETDAAIPPDAASPGPMPGAPPARRRAPAPAAPALAAGAAAGILLSIAAWTTAGLGVPAPHPAAGRPARGWLPIRPPDPEPAPEPPGPAEETAGLAAAALQFARALESGPSRPREAAIPLYRTVARDFPGTVAARRAEEIVAARDAERQAAAWFLVQAALGRAETLFAAGRLPEAEAAANEAEASGEAAARSARIRTRIRETSEALLRRAEGLAFGGSRREAEAALRTALASALAPERASARRLLRDMAGWAEPRRPPPVPEDLRSDVRAFFRLLRGGHFAAAEGLLRDWDRNPEREAGRPLAAFLAGQAVALRAAQAEALELLRAGSGKTFIRVGTDVGKVLGVQEGAALVEFARRERRLVRPQDLSGGDLTRILAPDPSDPRTPALRILLHLVDGEALDARRLLGGSGGLIERGTGEKLAETLRLLGEATPSGPP